MELPRRRFGSLQSTVRRLPVELIDHQLLGVEDLERLLVQDAHVALDAPHGRALDVAPVLQRGEGEQHQRQQDRDHEQRDRRAWHAVRPRRHGPAHATLASAADGSAVSDDMARNVAKEGDANMAAKNQADAAFDSKLADIEIMGFAQPPGPCAISSR